MGKPKKTDTQDTEWIATERSEDAEEALMREYHYHILRAAELKRFLRGCGMLGDD